jgi:hypothetical protein
MADQQQEQGFYERLKAIEEGKLIPGRGDADAKPSAAPKVNGSTEQLVRKERALKKHQAKIAKEALEQEIEKAQREIGFSSRLLIQATMPHSKPASGATEFKRNNGFVTVKFIADSEYGLPYGTYPRLLLTWVTTEAVRTKSPELVLGSSLSDFMSRLDLNSVGGGPQGSVPRVRQHMQRLFTCTIAATYQSKGQWQEIGLRPIEKSHIFWDPKRPHQGALWRSTIRLNQTFFEEIVRRPVPLDMSTLRALAKSKSPFAIDIYAWLTFRMSYLSEPTTIPWEALRLQFGCSEDIPMRSFKQWFIRRLNQVLGLYSQAQVELTNAGLILKPSQTHVTPKRLGQ